MTMTAQQAIRQSIRQNEIVTLEYDATAMESLLVECEDDAENGNVREFWGEADGNPWRVHMMLEVV